MKSLGFVSAVLPNLPLEDVLETARLTGYGCVEVMCWPVGRAERKYAGVTHIDVDAPETNLDARVAALCEKSGVSICSLGYYPNPLSPHVNEREQAVTHLRKVIRTASRLGVATVNTFVGRDWTKSVDDNWPRFVDTFGGLIELAEQCQVRLAIENCPMYFTADEWPGGKNLALSPAIWRRMFAEFPSANFGLNFDPSHLVWQHMDYLAPLREFSSRLFHVHAKDVRIDHHRLNEVGIMAHPLEYHSPKLPGLGEVDWGRFFSVLSDTGFSGPVCVEVEDRAYEGSFEQACAALRQSRAFMSNYMPLGTTSP